jgi:V8-like Glu-specific endopeptidase
MTSHYQDPREPDRGRPNAKGEKPLAEPPLNLTQAERIWSRSAIEEFAFPQPPAQRAHIVKRRAAGGERAQVTTPGLPRTRDISAFPAGVRRRPMRLRAQSRAVTPLFIFPPDNLRAFTDTTYPWRACGRVVTPAGQGSGAIVGLRHILTASHVIDWTVTNGSIGWLRFEPDFNNGNVFQPSFAQITYSYEKISQVQGEYDIAEDYVVCVMDRRIGDELGWLGTRNYDDGWDGGNFWVHVGYPDDIGGAQEPVFEGGFSIANSWSPGFFETGSGLDMETFTSLTHGDSGGPIFGFWSDGPHVVGVVSAEGTLDPVITDPSSRTANWVAGGNEMPDLVNQARSDHP